MSTNQEIIIGSRAYRKNPAVDRFQIGFDDLGDCRMSQIPSRSTLEVMDVPTPAGACEIEVSGVNAEYKSEYGYLSIYGYVSFKAALADKERTVARLRRAFPDMERDENGIVRNPQISTRLVNGEIVVGVFMSFESKDKPDTFVREAIAPFIDGLRRIGRPSVHAFICHASEDQPAARSLAAAMSRLGAEVWFDEWEIRVGDSIVQKIGDALGTVSHLVVLLSQNSVGKPWVQKELSSALMRQLSEKSITVLPLRLDNCSIPPILADVKYADARLGMEHALVEIEAALFSNPKASEGAS